MVKAVRSTWKRAALLATGVTKAKPRPKLKRAPKPFIVEVHVERGADAMPELVRFTVPVRARSLNEKLRDHWAGKKWTKSERDATRLLFPSKREVPAGPWAILLNRVSPSVQQLDRDDNLPGSLKAVRDEVALCLGFKDDEDSHLFWRYAQERGADWGVLITITTWARMQAKGGVR
jgi:hypothetical protein